MSELDKYIKDKTDSVNTIGITDGISEDYLKGICEGYYKIKLKGKTLAERLHESHSVKSHIEDLITELFEKYEPEIYEKLEFRIDSDDYDNSIEIYFEVSLPYPYEPCKEIRQAIYDLGFSTVYWNFMKDTMDVVCDRFIGREPELVKNSPDEIRGYEPRHNKHAHWIPNNYGYVDERFNEKEWLEKYNFKNKNSCG